MARGPRGERRPEDPAQAAVKVIDLAIGYISEPLAEKEKTKDASAVNLGQRGGLKGGIARSRALSPERRSEIAKRASQARWDAKISE